MFQNNQKHRALKRISNWVSSRENVRKTIGESSKEVEQEAFKRKAFIGYDIPILHLRTFAGFERVSRGVATRESSYLRLFLSRFAASKG